MALLSAAPPEACARAKRGQCALGAAPSHLIGLRSAQGRRARRICDRTSAFGGAATVCLEPRADPLGASLNIDRALQVSRTTSPTGCGGWVQLTH